ncbi:hypothetical protein AJ80_04364 [Polytolypa hystricis UAMH7299]|uniref:Uncharacterized protein n=1 Tax=Polytolypa hystricis (strain UAMH7299) TaxID=1447883 RepID=A0A2B7YCC3_POLH7|nr:hypothetical protein AJ80_04364 [Polytolypa hystricis UAMH7299]
MAPDLNTVPPSPRPRGPSSSSITSTPVNIPAGYSQQQQSSGISSPPLSRRVSQVMGPPPLPLHFPTSPTLSTAMATGVGDNTGVGSGPGPIRHPRPLTVADLHLELEKEQEAVVNRLSRELSLLRQQTASVASTASSTSVSLNEPLDFHQHLSGSTQPTPSRHRSSSNISSRSLAGTTGPLSGNVTSIAPSRDSGAPTSSSRPSLDISRTSLSREASGTASRGQSGAGSPSLSSSIQQQHQYGGDYVSHHHHHLSHTGSSSGSHSHSHRPSLTSFPSPSAQSQAFSTARYEEAAFHRAELEAVKRENDTLRRRVRDLETSLRDLRQAQAPREVDGERVEVRAAGQTATSNLTIALQGASISDSQTAKEDD